MREASALRTEPQLRKRAQCAGGVPMVSYCYLTGSERAFKVGQIKFAKRLNGLNSGRPGLLPRRQQIADKRKPDLASYLLWSIATSWAQWHSGNPSRLWEKMENCPGICLAHPKHDFSLVYRLVREKKVCLNHWSLWSSECFFSVAPPGLWKACLIVFTHKRSDNQA